MHRLSTALVLALGLLVCAPAAAQIRVAVLGVGGHASTMASMLTNDQQFADIQADPIEINSLQSIDQLADYDVVMGASDGGFNQNVVVGNILADFVDSGRGVVLAVFMQQLSIDIQGRWRTEGYDVVPAQSNNQYSMSTLGEVFDPSHPIMEGVEALQVDTYRSGDTPLVDGAVAVANYADGQPLAAIREDKSAPIAWCGFYPPPTFNSYSGDALRMLVNEIVWVSGGGGDNEPPVFGEVTVVGQVEEGQTVTFMATAIDPEGDAVTIQWDFDEDGVFDDAEGEVVEFTGLDGEDIITVGVRARDRRGRRTDTERQITILNLPPTFSSTPGLAATALELYEYTPTASDPAGDLDPITFELRGAPIGMTAADGQLSWVPSAQQGDQGTHEVTLAALDGDGGTTLQTWIITVAPDTDADGHVDPEDNCPNIANPGQEDGDGDGIGDVCDDDLDQDGVTNDVDNCVRIPNADQADNDDDGDGDPCDGDDDNDFVPDEEDNCPLTTNPNQGDADSDGVGDVCDPDSDSDGDGVLEGDNCPDVANPDQADLDADGRGDACDPDIDGDDIANAADNCPRIVNVDQFDLDEDGAGDICDTDDDDDDVRDEADACPREFGEGPDGCPVAPNNGANNGANNGNNGANNGANNGNNGANNGNGPNNGNNGVFNNGGPDDNGTNAEGKGGQASCTAAPGVPQGSFWIVLIGVAVALRRR